MVSDKGFIEAILGIDTSQPEEQIKEEMVDLVYQQIEHDLIESEMKEILKMLTADQLEEILFNLFD